MAYIKIRLSRLSLPTIAKNANKVDFSRASEHQLGLDKNFGILYNVNDDKFRFI